MGKAVMFMFFMWIMVCVAGSVSQGYMDFARTTLITTVDADSTSPIVVANTEGFPDAGVVTIEWENIAYSGKTTTTFFGTLVRPLVRGSGGTTKATHSSGVSVSTVSGAMLNGAAAYHIAVLVDDAGSLAFLALPLAFLELLGSFFFLPLQFLGTNLQFLSVLWMVFGLGTIVGIAIHLIAR